MFCPICSSEDTKVVDTRLSSDGTSIRRRRECEVCQYRFSTNEEVELLDLRVLKRDGSHETYSREKVVRGLLRALEKRMYTEADFRNLIHQIERDIQRRRVDEIASSMIGEVVMERLKTFDQVAYIRFASVYRSFNDVDSFKRELDELKG